MQHRQKCSIQKIKKASLYGERELAPAIKEPCSIVKLKMDSAHTTVRADSGGSRGYADEFVSQNKILLTATTKASLGDRLEVFGYAIKITGLHPRFSVRGQLDHYEVAGEAWV